MSMERLEIEAHGFCPVCSAVVNPASRLERSEVVPCPECQSLLVVEGWDGPRLVFGEAPRAEEDWGE
jgi:lysine biosynthesis protein LysW